LVIPAVAQAHCAKPRHRTAGPELCRSLHPGTASGLGPGTRKTRRQTDLIRRLSYVLTGLPPSAADADRFVADTSVDAYERLVDRTLASPNFGEHWARHWLDLVRFGETRGYEWNYEIIGAWRYRDYLIRAFNGDVPYDQLVREHIAGDLLDNPRLNAKEGINESVIGTAFYRLGEAGHDDCIMFREIALDVIDNEIDTLSKTFQGMTVSCARCHDHKLDPIPTEDYYGLYSILNSSRVVTHTIDVPDLNRDRIQRLKQLKQQIRVELGSIWKREAADISRYMLASLNLSAQDSPVEEIRTKPARLLEELAGVFRPEIGASFVPLGSAGLQNRFPTAIPVRRSSSSCASVQA
jgi:hypothetical protein